MNASVGTYSDCTGRALVVGVEIDTCIPGLYFVGHNPGPFTPLLGYGAGTIIIWYDGSGTAHRYKVFARQSWGSGIPGTPPQNGAAIQLQTCVTSSGSVELIIDGTPA